MHHEFVKFIFEILNTKIFFLRRLGRDFGRFGIYQMVYTGSAVRQERMSRGLKPRILKCPLMSGLKPGPISEARTIAEANADADFLRE